MLQQTIMYDDDDDVLVTTYTVCKSADLILSLFLDSNKIFDQFTFCVRVQ